MRVLVIENDEDTRLLYRVALELAGFEVECCAGATEGLAAATVRSADCAIVDLGLDEGDGYDVATRLRAAHPTMHLVAVTGWADEAHRVRALAAGFDELLPKPLEPGALVAAIRAGRPADRS